MAEAAMLLARVHHLPLVPSITSNLPREQFENPFKAPIARALDVAHRSSTPQTSLQQAVYRLLVGEQADIEATLVKMDGLQRQAQTLVGKRVLTHGDCHGDNLLKDEHGRLHLIDWGGLAAGPVERDLMFWTGDTFAYFLNQYARRQPNLSLHPKVFEFYFYRWCLQEVADYVTRLLFQQHNPIEDEHAWSELQDYLPIRHASIARGVSDVQEVINRVLK